MQTETAPFTCTLRVDCETHVVMDGGKLERVESGDMHFEVTETDTRSTAQAAKVARNVAIIRASAQAGWLAYVYGACTVRVDGAEVFTLTGSRTRS